MRPRHSLWCTRSGVYVRGAEAWFGSETWDMPTGLHLPGFNAKWGLLCRVNEQKPVNHLLSGSGWGVGSRIPEAFGRESSSWGLGPDSGQERNLLCREGAAGGVEFLGYRFSWRLAGCLQLQLLGSKACAGPGGRTRSLNPGGAACMYAWAVPT